MEDEQQGGRRVCLSLSVCVFVCAGVCLAMLQVVDDPGDGLLSCGADITLQKHHTWVSTGISVHRDAMSRNITHSSSIGYTINSADHREFCLVFFVGKGSNQTLRNSFWSALYFLLYLVALRRIDFYLLTQTETDTFIITLQPKMKSLICFHHGVAILQLFSTHSEVHKVQELLQHFSHDGEISFWQVLPHSSHIQLGAKRNQIRK